MPRQNRVTPFGDIVALAGRGLVMGNRGILHNDDQQIIRYSQVRRWLVCRTEFRGRHRTIMRPHSYTELFFLDEATALAAGHRPCAECRHTDYQQFRTLWASCRGEPVNADIIDRQLHAERVVGRRGKRTHRSHLRDLPDGTFIALEDRAWLVWGDSLFAWSDLGYQKRRPRLSLHDVDVLTPQSTVMVLRTGYRAGVHPSVAP
ncbi:MAG: hypothetical protein JO343_03005 [Candidatus Eremiobacteraeota bacterium]|nr:hypothetical protein [Candidatus Eremiobacteraeota bacterium]MBV8460008.1 hypothetical protein [Candidatus Eremiobacteraeota bacterium]MBV8668950.1 hypothetical protein [Candidatus Eremiobacteraeota bacterium]